MNTCKTCKYWSDNLKIVDKVSDCGKVGSYDSGEMTFAMDITVDDDSNLNSYLMTGEDFGCIHHKDKD